MRKNCIKLNKSPEELAALIVGRWKSGAPLAKHHTSDPVGQEFADENDFQYRETIVDSGSIRTLDSDGDGVNTPKFSHVRLANPRDDSRRPDLEKPSHNRTVNAENRILRRGIPYGMALADDPDSKNGGRGILFLCYQRDLWKQFEFIQSNWFNSNNYPEDEGPHADVIKLLRGDVGYSKLGLERFVTTKGGAYFFSPSISALKNLKRDFSTQ
jgi:Dyp-type peroxidase family